MKVGKELFIMDNREYGCGCQYNEDMLELGIILRKKSKSGYWYVRSENFGWSKLSGFAYIGSLTGKGWLGKILPDTECRSTIYNYGKGLMVQNFHHDSCTGEEKYYCIPISKRVFGNRSYKGRA
jgi:hypothetical protein